MLIKFMQESEIYSSVFCTSMTISPSFFHAFATCTPFVADSGTAIPLQMFRIWREQRVFVASLCELVQMVTDFGGVSAWRFAQVQRHAVFIRRRFIRLGLFLRWCDSNELQAMWRTMVTLCKQPASYRWSGAAPLHAGRIPRFRASPSRDPSLWILGAVARLHRRACKALRRVWPIAVGFKVCC